MKKIYIFTAVLATFATASQAQPQMQNREMGRVLSATPISQQIGTPRQNCYTDQVAVQGQKSGAGTVMGTIAGGALGTQIGQGNGRTLAIALGAITGAVVGNNIEGAPQAQMQNVQRCSTETVYENRVVGYNVVYEYAGIQYSARMSRDPGQFVPVRVSAAD